MSAEATSQGREVMQAREIKEYKGRLCAMAAELEGEQLSVIAMKHKLNVSAKARTSIFAKPNALLEKCKTILVQRKKAWDELRMTRMQLECKREEHVEQLRLIAAKGGNKAQDKLRMTRMQLESKREEHVEQWRLIAAEHDEARDEPRMTRLQQEDKRRRRRSLSSDGGGNDNNNNDDLTSLK